MKNNKTTALSGPAVLFFSPSWVACAGAEISAEEQGHRVFCVEVRDLNSWRAAAEGR